MTRAAVIGAAAASRRRAGSSGGEIVFEGPITISSGQTVSNRHFRSTSPGTPAVTINTTSPVTLEHCSVEHAGWGVANDLGGAAFGAQVTIRNCKFTALSPGSATTFSQRAVRMEKPGSLVVERCTLRDGHGIYILAPGVTVSPVTIRYNECINVGRYGAGNNLVQFVQFDKTTAPAEIAWNRVTNTYGESEVEDNINMFSSQGTGSGAGRIRIHHNLIDGGYARTGNGADYRGGGIMLGDDGGQWMVAEFNRIVSTSNYGVAIVAGTHLLINANRIVQDGRTGSPVPAASTPGQAHNIGLADGQNHFNLGVGFTSGHVDITPAQLAGGYTTTAGGAAYALNSAKTAVRMRAPVAGGTTSSGTKYARTEYREYNEAGTDKMAFAPNTGTHYIKGRTKLIHLAPVKPWVTIAQMHNASDDQIELLTRVDAGSLRLMIYLNQVTITNPYMLSSVAVGDTIDWEIRLVGGVLSIFVNGADRLAGFTSLKNTFSGYTTADMYFKAGCYNQSNWKSDGSGSETSSTEYFEVELSGLEHWHTGWPAAQGSAQGSSDPLPSTHGPEYGDGIALWDSDDPDHSTGPDTLATGNVVGWWNSPKGARSDLWLPACNPSDGCTGNTSLTSDPDAQVTAAHEQAERDGWAFDLVNAGLTVGADW